MHMQNAWKDVAHCYFFLFTKYHLPRQVSEYGPFDLSSLVSLSLFSRIENYSWLQRSDSG